MKKISLILIFIFLTGLFSGLFFSTNLSESGNETLSSFMLSGISSTDTGFFKIFTSSFSSNAFLFIIMLPAAFITVLRPLPFMILWYKSFAIGFCSGLVYINCDTDAFAISMLKLFPQNVFFIPAFIIFAISILLWKSNTIKNRQKRRIDVSLPVKTFILSLALLTMGALVEAAFHQAVL